MGSSARIRLAAPLDPGGPARGTGSRSRWRAASIPVSGTVLSRRRRRFGALILEDRTLPADPQETAATLAGVIGRKLETLTLDRGGPAACRPGPLCSAGIDPEVPDLSDEALAASVGDVAGNRT